MSLPSHPDHADRAGAAAADELVPSAGAVGAVVRKGPGAERPIVVVVDDDPTVAQVLADTIQPEFEALPLTAPEAALAALSDRHVAVLITDQRMPGMGGVELLTEARRRHPDVVGVLTTAYADADSAIQAINEARAFGYLAKPWDTDELLILVRRAVDAHRALRRDLGEQQQRELRVLEQLSQSAPAPVTAQQFGATSLRAGNPHLFDELLRWYASLLERALEQRIYKIDHLVSDALRDLADRLGAHRAGPRDVVEIHTTAMRLRLATATPDQAEAYGEEGRLLVLELMGYLVSYYRGFALGIQS